MSTARTPEQSQLDFLEISNKFHGSYSVLFAALEPVLGNKIIKS